MKKNYYAEYVAEVMNDTAIEQKMFFDISYEDIKAMSREERRAVRNRCEEHMNANDDFSRYYAVYSRVSAVEDDEYRAENESKVRDYFNQWFAGKTWDEIRDNEELYERWGFYSDWHKDCYGYRPHGIVCGEYIRPW